MHSITLELFLQDQVLFTRSTSSTLLQ